MENYMTPEELRAIADYCDSLQPVWDVITSGLKAGVSVEIEGEGLELNVYDSNGETLGRITWADSGPAFYPSVSNAD